MKRVILVVSLALLLAGAASAFDPANLNSIEFANNTGFDIMYLFFSPGDSEYWGPDILGSERILYDGESLGFYLHYPHSCDDFDFLAIDEDGDAYVIWDYTICDGSSEQIEITLDHFEPDYTADMDFVELSLNSSIDYDIYFAFVSPRDSSMYGVDMLDEETILYPGETLSLVVPAGKSPAAYDVMVVDEDADTYSFWVEISSARSDWTFAVEPGDMD
jgi:hypothetical protein